MPSATLQKLASSLSSGGGGGNDGSPSGSSRGGVIRGILQSLRAHTGFSGGADSGSPRGSRSGHAEGLRTNMPLCSQGQHGLTSNNDILHSELEDWEHDEVRSLISSGASGVAPAIPPRMAILGDNSVAQEPKLRSHSERRLGNSQTDLACAQRDNSSPCLVAQVNEALKSETSSSGFKVSTASRLPFAGFRVAHDASSPDTSATWLPNLPNSNSNSQNLSIQHLPSGGSGVGSRPPSGPVSGAWQSWLEPLSPPVETAARQGNGDLPLASTAEYKRSPTPAQMRPTTGLRACRTTPQQQSLIEAAVATDPPGRPQPMQLPTPAAVPLQASPVELPAVAKACRQPRRLVAVSGGGAADGAAMAAVADAVIAIADGEVVIVRGSSSGSGSGSGSMSSVAMSADNAISLATATAAAAARGADVGAASAPAPHAAVESGLQRFRSSTELSAAAVSQAVQRLQLRQQQEKVAGRIHRTAALYHQYHHSHHNHHGAAAGQRTTTVGSDTSNGGGRGAGGGEAGGGCLTLSSPRPHSPGPQVSPARRLGLHAARSSTSAPPFQYQHTQQHYQQVLYESHRGAAATFGAQSRPAAELNSGLDEWLGDVPDMTSGRLALAQKAGSPAAAAAAAGSNTELRNSISCTEGRVSAAERLQALVSSAASGDDAASYLQQLLIPEVPSTASVELQYSNTHNRIPSVLSLAYGSSSGPPAGPNGSGIWGGLLGSAGGAGSNGMAYCAGSPMGPHSNCEPLCSGETEVRVGSGAGNAVPSDWCSPALGGSGVDSSCAPHHHHHHHHHLAQAGSVASSTGARLSNGSGSIGTTHNSAVAAAAAATAAAHAGKSAEQLLEELRELYGEDMAANTTASPAGCLAGVAGLPLHAQPCSSPAASLSMGSNEEPREPALDGIESFPQSYGNGECVGSSGQPRTASFSSAASRGAAPATAPLMSNAVQRHVQREELVAALWRLVRSKNGDAVSYLLAIDPSEKANRVIAPMLKDMRSWVYLNMW